MLGVYIGFVCRTNCLFDHFGSLGASCYLSFEVQVGKDPGLKVQGLGPGNLD